MGIAIDLGEPVAGSLTVRTAANIRALLAYRGLKQRDLAKALERNEVWVSVRMRGHQPISLADLDAIAQVLEVEPADLIPKSVAATRDELRDDLPLSVTRRPARRPCLPVRPTPTRPPRGPLFRQQTGLQRVLAS